eukprot:TRINITY_DN1562_c2_g1_i2.p1 TRINITY_DN1562_c2_g1~~TRINITY_DN1562_c2_g1_i2.p1  ORF type:complete len:221 (+),score=11.74 TRINITY_DN1562_c2_g1_i2:27-689(+)
MMALELSTTVSVTTESVFEQWARGLFVAMQKSVSSDITFYPYLPTLLPTAALAPASPLPTSVDPQPITSGYHVSLSRTVALRRHQITPFIQLLRSAFQDQPRFEMEFSEHEVFINDDHTRSFIALRVAEGKSHICQLIKKANDIMQEFSQPTFYEDPRPHTTVGWTLGDILPRLHELGIPCVAPLQNGIAALPDKQHVPRIVARRIECRCGKDVYVFPLH